MTGLVLDTNVLVSALMNPKGKPAHIYCRVAKGQAKVYYNDKIMYEYKDVLFRGYLKIDKNDAQEVIDVIVKKGTNLTVVPSTIPLPDEDDRVFYDTAVSAGAYLVTGNMKHFPQEQFILTPADFLTLAADI